MDDKKKKIIRQKYLTNNTEINKMYYLLNRVFFPLITDPYFVTFFDIILLFNTHSR